MSEMKQKIYLINTSIVHMLPDVSGCIKNERGEIIGSHISSSIDWLRIDLARKIDENKFDIIDQLEDIDDE